MLEWLKNHPTEDLALALMFLNLLGKLAGEVKNQTAAKALAFLSALGPDVTAAAKVLLPGKGPDAK